MRYNKKGMCIFARSCAFWGTYARQTLSAAALAAISDGERRRHGDHQPFIHFEPSQGDGALHHRYPRRVRIVPAYLKERLGLHPQEDRRRVQKLPLRQGEEIARNAHLLSRAEAFPRRSDGRGARRLVQDDHLPPGARQPPHCVQVLPLQSEKGSPQRLRLCHRRAFEREGGSAG